MYRLVGTDDHTHDRPKHDSHFMLRPRNNSRLLTSAPFSGTRHDFGLTPEVEVHAIKQTVLAGPESALGPIARVRLYKS